MVWITNQGDFRQRPPIHVTLRKSIVWKTPRQAEHLHGFPPPNGWTLRAKESMGGAIPTPSRERPTRRLEVLAPDRNGRSQQPYQLHHSSSPGACPIGISPNPRPYHAPDHEERTSRRKSSPGVQKSRTGPSGVEQGGRNDPRDPVQSWRHRLARSEKSSPPLSDAQTSPQTSWPFHNHERGVSCRLSAPTTPGLDHP
jgi:hypothetical protein